MAEVKFTELPAGAALTGAEIIADVQGGVSVQSTMNDIKTFVEESASTGVQVYVDSAIGIDAANRGGPLSPYATISFALSQITDASPAKLYNINASGTFTDTTWVIKPNISYNFNAGSYTLTGAVTLDATFSGGGNVTIRNIDQLSAVAGITLDYAGVSAGFSVIIFDFVITSAPTTFTLLGNPADVSVFLSNSLIGLAGAPNVIASDILGGFINSSFGDVKFDHTSDGTAPSFGISNTTVAGNFEVDDSSSTLGLDLELNGVRISGFTDFTSSGAGGLNVNSIAGRYDGTLTVDGANSLLTADVLQNTVVFTGGASASNVVIEARYAVSGGTGITYDPLDGIISQTASPDPTSYGEMFFQDNAVETVIAVQGTPVKVNATYTAGDVLNFTESTGTLTYTGTDTLEFGLNLSLTATMNLVTGNISVYVFKNGSEVTKSVQTIFAGSTSPALQSVSVNALIGLATNDTIEVFVSNDDGTDNITVEDLNITLLSQGGTPGVIPDQVVVAWDGLTTPVSVTAGTDITITGGVISYVGTSGDNVVTSWDGLTTPVAVTAGNGISITGGVIEAIGGPGGEDLQLAYDNGNVIQLAASTPVIIETNTPTIAPEIALSLEAIPVIGNTAGQYNFKGQDEFGNPQVYGRIDCTITSGTDGAESARVGISASDATSGSIQQFVSFDGDSGVTSFSKFVFVDAPFRQRNGNAEFNFPAVSSGFLTVYMNGASYAYQVDYTDPVSGFDFGVVPSVNSANVNYTVGTSTGFTIDYANPLETVWTSLSGTNVIPANLFLIGQTIEIEVTGANIVDIPLPNVDSGSFFRFTFGSIIDVDCENIPLGNTTTRSEPFSLKINITRINFNTIVFSAFGSYYDHNQNNKPIIFLPATFTFTYDASVSNAIDLQYSNGNSPGNTFDFRAYTLNINMR